MGQEGLVPRGSRPLLGHLCVQWVLEVQGCHPGPSCHPARDLLYIPVLGGLSVLGVPWLLPGLLVLALQEVQGFGDRIQHLQVAQVHLGSLGDPWALFCLEVQRHPSLQVLPQDQVALEALEIPWVLSGHLFRHILGHLDTLEVLVGLGDPVALADHSHLALLLGSGHFPGDLEAQELLSDHQGQGVPDLQVGPAQECHP